jgi:hypothetical protein
MRLRCWAILCGVLACAAMAAPVLAQSPSAEAPAAQLGPPSNAYLPPPLSSFQQPAGADTDRAAAQKDGKEESKDRKDGKEGSKAEKKDKQESKAEKDKPKKDDKASKEAEWVEVGKDRSLRARWENGFVADTADKSFRIHLGGRLEFDNSWFTQDDNILIGRSPDQRMLDGTLFRRARLRADGLLWELIDFACEVNFANIQDVSNVDNDLVQVGSVGLTDFYLTFREVPWLGNVRVGHFQAPNSLERYSSSNAWYYMERSSMFDAFYNPNDYQNGVMVFNSYFDDRVTLAGSAAWIGKSNVQSSASAPTKASTATRDG